MKFQVQQAKRELIWVKTALMAPSGGGKTYSALRLATGMLEALKEKGQEKNGKILLANTEASRGLYYANEFKYDIVHMLSPHSPETYVELIEFAVEQEYPVLIIDSASHEWEGKGGCLELHQQSGGTYQAWAKITPRHDKFIMALADSPIHIIATMRGKDAYEMEKTEAGKTIVKKLGIGAKQREGFEYEFTVTFLLDQKTNMASVQKDNTHLFENEGDVLLSESHGRKLIEWSNSGEGYTIPVRNTKTPVEVMSELKEKIVARAKEIGGSKNTALMDVMKKYDKAGNPNRVNDIGKLQELLIELDNIKLYQEETKEKETEEQ